MVSRRRYQERPAMRKTKPKMTHGKRCETKKITRGNRSVKQIKNKSRQIAKKEWKKEKKSTGTGGPTYGISTKTVSDEKGKKKKKKKGEKKSAYFKKKKNKYRVGCKQKHTANAAKVAQLRNWGQNKVVMSPKKQHYNAARASTQPVNPTAKAKLAKTTECRHSSARESLGGRGRRKYARRTPLTKQKRVYERETRSTFGEQRKSIS